MLQVLTMQKYHGQRLLAIQQRQDSTYQHVGKTLEGRSRDKPIRQAKVRNRSLWNHDMGPQCDRKYPCSLFGSIAHKGRRSGNQAVS
jgi:hypothetical protein